jgi:hypothetical protein
MLEQIRRTLGEYNFAGQYQQAPSPQGGGMMKAAWFRRYAPNDGASDILGVSPFRRRQGCPLPARGCGISSLVPISTDR